MFLSGSLLVVSGHSPGDLTSKYDALHQGHTSSSSAPAAASASEPCTSAEKTCSAALAMPSGTGSDLHTLQPLCFGHEQ